MDCIDRQVFDAITTSPKSLQTLLQCLLPTPPKSSFVTIRLSREGLKLVVGGLRFAWQWHSPQSLFPMLPPIIFLQDFRVLPSLGPLLYTSISTDASRRFPRIYTILKIYIHPRWPRRRITTSSPAPFIFVSHSSSQSTLFVFLIWQWLME